MTIDEAEIELREFLKKYGEIDDDIFDWNDVELVKKGLLIDADDIYETVKTYLSEDNYYTNYDMLRDIIKYDVSLEKTFGCLSESGLDLDGIGSFYDIARWVLYVRAEDICSWIYYDDVQEEIDRLNDLVLADDDEED